MIRNVITIFLAVASFSCQSAPATTRVFNIGTAKNLFLLLCEYSETHGRMPHSLYNLDPAIVSWGDRHPTITDFRCISNDRTHKADFLYFRACTNLDKLKPDTIVLASPFEPSSDEERLIVQADGHAKYISESDFELALSKTNKEGEQAVTPNGP